MAYQRAHVGLQRIAGHDFQPSRIMRGDIAKRSQSAFIALDGHDARRTQRQQRARQPAGAGADFDNGRAFQRFADARDPRRQIEIEQEILAERFLGG